MPTYQELLEKYKTGVSQSKADYEAIKAIQPGTVVDPRYGVNEQAGVLKDRIGNAYNSYLVNSSSQSFADLANAYNAENPNSDYTKFLADLKDAGAAEEHITNVTKNYSDMVLVNGVPKKRSALTEEQQNELGVANGTLIKVKVGNGWGYVPKGSAGEANMPNIGTNNTSNAANANSTPTQTTPPLQNTTQATQLLKVGTGTKEAPNEDVRRIQSLLGATPDGIFGPQTKSKVMAFQQANGLVVDGIVGPETLAALNKTGSISTNTGNTGFNINQPSYVVKPGDKFDPYTGKPLANTTPGSVVKNPQEEIQGINNQANADAEKDLALFKETLGNKVDVSDTKKLVDAITKTYETGPSKEATTSLEQKLANKRTELKLDVKEAELASIDANLEKLDSDWLALQQKEENRLVSLGQMNRRKSAQQIEYERARDELSRKRNSIVRELDMKYGVINTFMQYAEKDYENAQSEYNTKINQAISITNLLKNVEESQKSDNEKIMDNARANVQVMLGALKGKKFPELDAKTKLELKNMELQAGLPAGFVEFAMSAVDDPVVSIGGEFTDATGKRQVPIYTKDPSTGVVSTKVVTIGTDAGKVNEAKNEADDIAAAILDFKNAMKQNNWRGINPDAYNYYKTEIQKLYGASAVLKLDKAIKDAGLQVDDGNFKSSREG